MATSFLLCALVACTFGGRNHCNGRHNMNLPNLKRSAAASVAKGVGVACEPWMQDWPVEATDGARVEEFLSYLERQP